MGEVYLAEDARTPPSSGIEDIASSLLVDLRVEFPFDALHDDPRYKDLLKRMGLPD